MIFWTHWRSTCFLRGPLEWVTDAKNVNGSYVIDLQSHVIAICGNRSEEIAGRWQNNSLCQRYLLGVVYKVLNRKTLSGETFCFPEKSLLYFTSCWLANDQLSWNVLLFSCNRIGQLCLSGPGYSSHTVSCHHMLDTLWLYFRNIGKENKVQDRG